MRTIDATPCGDRLKDSLRIAAQLTGRGRISSTESDDWQRIERCQSSGFAISALDFLPFPASLPEEQDARACHRAFGNDNG